MYIYTYVCEKRVLSSRDVRTPLRYMSLLVAMRLLGVTGTRPAGGGEFPTLLALYVFREDIQTSLSGFWN